jgi:hypothetical protein
MRGRGSLPGRVADEKPDTVIAGREDGRPSGPGDERRDQASLPRQLSGAAPINPQNPTPLNDQNDSLWAAARSTLLTAKRSLERLKLGWGNDFNTRVGGSGT